VLIPLERSQGQNELEGQNETHQRREHVEKQKVFKVPTMMSCGQGGAKSLASESRLLQARFGDAAMRAQMQVQARTEGADRVQIGDLAVVVGCMDAWPASGACGAQSQAMCALQQDWVLRARRGDAPQRQLEEVAAGRCITVGMSTSA